MVVTSTWPRVETARRSVTILGSTGSVGCNTVDLIGRQPEVFAVEALTGNRNVVLLAEQARRLRPKLAVVADANSYRDLKQELSGTGIEVGAGPEALIDAASRPAQFVMAAIVGAAGLEPTLAAIRRGAIIGLANKECLVCAGSLVVSEVRRCGATLVPVDSEHSAIFQVFSFDNAEKVEAIILTASGGPFRTFDREAMSSVTPAEAVAHPNWNMGAKISVDSATMMNKGLELIEAFHLFPVSEGQIKIIVHPQSVVHSMVAYVDGSVLAQMGTPDMRTPIAYALAWPKRMPAPAPRLELVKIGTLTFENPDEDRFPALRIARQALSSGNAACAILNAANEIAVQSFLTGKIGFLDISQVVEATMSAIPNRTLDTLADVVDIDELARDTARVLASKRAAKTAYVT